MEELVTLYTSAQHNDPSPKVCQYYSNYTGAEALQAAISNLQLPLNRDYILYAIRANSSDGQFFEVPLNDTLISSGLITGSLLLVLPRTEVSNNTISPDNSAQNTSQPQDSISPPKSSSEDSILSANDTISGLPPSPTDASNTNSEPSMIGLPPAPIDDDDSQLDSLLPPLQASQFSSPLVPQLPPAPIDDDNSQLDSLLPPSQANNDSPLPSPLTPPLTPKTINNNDNNKNDDNNETSQLDSLLPPFNNSLPPLPGKGFNIKIGDLSTKPEEKSNIVPSPDDLGMTPLSPMDNITHYTLDDSTQDDFFAKQVNSAMEDYYHQQGISLPHSLPQNSQELDPLSLSLPPLPEIVPLTESDNYFDSLKPSVLLAPLPENSEVDPNLSTDNNEINLSYQSSPLTQSYSDININSNYNDPSSFQTNSPLLSYDPNLGYSTESSIDIGNLNSSGNPSLLSILSPSSSKGDLLDSSTDDPDQQTIQVPRQRHRIKARYDTYNQISQEAYQSALRLNLNIDDHISKFDADGDFGNLKDESNITSPEDMITIQTFFHFEPESYAVAYPRIRRLPYQTHE